MHQTNTHAAPPSLRPRILRKDCDGAQFKWLSIKEPRGSDEKELKNNGCGELETALALASPNLAGATLDKGLSVASSKMIHLRFFVAGAPSEAWGAAVSSSGDGRGGKATGRLRIFRE